MSELHTDGNETAGLLEEILAVEITTVTRTCQGCGDASPLGAHRAYHGAAVVLRCPGCDAVAVRVGERDGELVVEWRGTYRIARG